MGHKGDYSLLGIFAILYVLAVYRFQTFPKYILLVTLTFSSTYILWGITHHIKAKNFHTRIVLEYLLVAILGMAIISTLLL